MNVEDIIRYITRNKIDSIIHCAAKVGGIKANSDHLGEFFYKNVIMNTNRYPEIRQLARPHPTSTSHQKKNSLATICFGLKTVAPVFTPLEMVLLEKNFMSEC